MRVKGYLALHQCAAVLLVLVLLTGIFGLILLIAQLDDLGKSDYGIGEAFLFVLFSLPRLLFHLFPVAVITGGTMALAFLQRNGEWPAMRSLGLSRTHAFGALLQGGLLLAVAAAVNAEYLMPLAEPVARDSRHQALTGEVRRLRDLWLKRRNMHIYIGQVLPGGRVKDVRVYGYSGGRLVRQMQAREARPRDGQWLLLDVRHVLLEPSGARQQRLAELEWELPLLPRGLQYGVRPERLPLGVLLEHSRYLRDSGREEGSEYEVALWKRLLHAPLLLLLGVLAVPLAGLSGGLPPAARVLLGFTAGLVWYVTYGIFGQLAVIYRLSASACAVVPCILLLGITAVLAARLR